MDVAKIHDLLAWPTIDQTNVIPIVVVCIMKEGVFLVKRGINLSISTWQGVVGSYHNLSLGFTTKAKACEGASQE